MKDATLKQVGKIISIFEDTSRERIQAMLPYLAILRDANVAEMNLDDFRKACGLQLTMHHIFRLIGRSTSCTTEELVKAGHYDWVNDYITSRNFPIRAHEPDEAEVILLDFDHDPTSEEALVVAEKQRLVIPTYEDALRFGVQYPEEQRKGPIVFLHEPWLNPRDNRGVVVLDGNASDRHLGLRWFGIGWHRNCRFAFLRK